MSDAASLLDILRSQNERMQRLFAALETGVADLVGTSEKSNELLGKLAAMETALSDMTHALEGNTTGQAIDRLTAALGSMRHEVTVQAPAVTLECAMPPMPAPVIEVSGPSVGSEWEIRMPPRKYGDPERVAHVRRVK